MIASLNFNYIFFKCTKDRAYSFFFCVLFPGRPGSSGRSSFLSYPNTTPHTANMSSSNPGERNTPGDERNTDASLFPPSITVAFLVFISSDSAWICICRRFRNWNSPLSIPFKNPGFVELVLDDAPVSHPVLLNVRLKS